MQQAVQEVAASSTSWQPHACCGCRLHALVSAPRSAQRSASGSAVAGSARISRPTGSGRVFQNHPPPSCGCRAPSRIRL